MPLFSVTNVNFKNVVNYLHIEIGQHKSTFICGKSGSGKSTLLKLLNASVSPDSGEILFQNKPIGDYDIIKLRRDIMLVSQSVFLFDDTIKNNFREFYRYREQTLPDDSTLKEYMRICAADFSFDMNCRAMSGGERQRVFIAICLSFMPKVLMLDEPTSALDIHTSKALMENIKCHCIENNITLIVITHDRLLAEQYADEVIILDSGGGVS